MTRNKILAIPLAIALGLEIIAPGGEEQHPHTEKEIILAPEPTGSEADALAPFATPPENPWLSDFALRITKPEELSGWWVKYRNDTIWWFGHSPTDADMRRSTVQRDCRHTKPEYARRKARG